MDQISLTLPEDSMLHQSDLDKDYMDSYYTIVPDKINIENAAAAFLETTPGWLENLSNWKDQIVMNYQQKDPEEIEQLGQRFSHPEFEPGKKAGNFMVFQKTENEMILGRDDKHLSFRVSLYFLKQPDHPKHHKYLVISTLVQVNNWMGKLFFFPVKPFHQEMAPYTTNQIGMKLKDPDYRKKVLKIDV